MGATSHRIGVRGKSPSRVVILGGGFGGVYAALELDRWLAKRPDVEVTLVSRENFLLFTPMLHEVAASDLDVTHIVSPIRKMLRRVDFFHGSVESIDLTQRRVSLMHGEDGHPHDLEYDHLVLALGSVTGFFGVPGVADTCLTMKSLGDALHLRNHVIQRLEEADFECLSTHRASLLTFVVAGGGFAGVETVAALNDFLREAVTFYPNLSEEMLKIVLIHAGEHLLPEIGEELGRYAERQLARRGVEVVLGVGVAESQPGRVRLSDGRRYETSTLVWTAGTTPHPLLATLPVATDRGRVRVDEHLQVEGHPGVWAVGDCALVPDGRRGGFHPPTAQHGLRQGKAVARNVMAAIEGRAPKAFSFTTLGQLAAIGRRTGVARIGRFNFSGFWAWWMWRTVYLAKLPGLEKKVRVMIDWTLDILFSKDLVMVPTQRTEAGVARPVAGASPVKQRAAVVR